MAHLSVSTSLICSLNTLACVPITWLVPASIATLQEASFLRHSSSLTVNKISPSTVPVKAAGTLYFTNVDPMKHQMHFSNSNSCAWVSCISTSPFLVPNFLQQKNLEWLFDKCPGKNTKRIRNSLFHIWPGRTGLD